MVGFAGMTNLDRLCAAEGVTGGTIHDYDRRLNAFKLAGKSIACMEYSEFRDFASKLNAAGDYDGAMLIAKAMVAHMQFNRMC